MKNILKTWFMETKDGRGVYKDLRGRVTLEADSNMRCEFIEGQRHGDKETLAKEASDLLDVECVWKCGPDWTEETFTRPGESPLEKQ